MFEFAYCGVCLCWLRCVVLVFGWLFGWLVSLRMLAGGLCWFDVWCLDFFCLDVFMVILVCCGLRFLV